MTTKRRADRALWAYGEGTVPVSNGNPAHVCPLALRGAPFHGGGLMSGSPGDTSSTHGGEPQIDGNGLDTVEQKQPADAAAAIGALPADVRPVMAATVVHGLGTVEQKRAA